MDKPIQPASRFAPEPTDVAGVLVVVTPLSVTEAECGFLEDVLSADERARAGRFPDKLRRRYVVGRGRLRLLLAFLLAGHPAAIEFLYGNWGKPSLGGRFAGKIHFNLTHSQDCCLIAVSRESPVGIDLEMHSRSYTVEWSGRMAAAILGAEELLAWQQLPEALKPTTLLEAWVAKEATLKAVGCGIAGGLQRVRLPLPLGRPVAAPLGPPLVRVALPPADEIPGGDVSVGLLDVVPQAFAAVACIDPLRAVQMTTFDAIAGRLRDLLR